jgi:endoglycosylceramidase
MITSSFALTLSVAMIASACSASDPNDTSSDDEQPVEDHLTGPGEPRELRPLHVEDQRIVDDLGRDVLLRGANVNSLGEYHQGDPDEEPTAPVTDGDWAAMAARGLSVTRLVVSWSRLEPEPGEIDTDHLDQIADTVAAANDHGIYVVLDMHQDAWGPFIASPPDVTCEPGAEPAIGWDGAPAWATLVGDASTCVTGGRESAPAVKAAFSSFYSNAPGPDGVGLRDHLVDVWGAVAERFATTTGVAGYDLLNEPNYVEPSAENLAGYSEFVSKSIQAIRSAELDAGTDPKPVLVEPIVMYPLPDTLPDPFVGTDRGSGAPDTSANLVFAPHNYAESIGPKVLSVEQTFEVGQAGADELGAALWIGEYGFWDTSPETLSVARRFAAEEDSRVLGGAWWQWRQTCGDPHSVGTPGATATEDQVHLNTMGCPGNEDLGPTEEFLTILGRAFPRASPGRVTNLQSDPDTASFSMEATGAEAGSILVVWVPESADDTGPAVTSSAGLDEVEVIDVDGGKFVTATTTGSDYSLVLSGE